MPRPRHVSEESLLELLSSVDIFSEVAVYQQIENNIQFGIASGRIAANDQLPSVRELSELLNVNPNTIAKAYRDLEVMGLVYTRRGMGVFVTDDAVKICNRVCRERIVARMYEVAAEAVAAGFKEREAVSVFKKCLAETQQPYSKVPKSVLDLAKKSS